MKRQLGLYLLLIAAAAATRVLPHAWNFAPVTAVAIVAAIYLPIRQAIGLPLIIRFTSDLVIGFFAWPQMLAVYSSHLFGIFAGLWVKKRKTTARVLAAPMISALVFFLITNFAFLYPVSAYSHNLSGILLSYTNGLPFLRGTLLGDVVYTSLLVGAVELVYFYRTRKIAKLAKSAIV